MIIIEFKQFMIPHSAKFLRHLNFLQFKNISLNKVRAIWSKDVVSSIS